MPNGNTLVGDTQVQFNNDQVRLLVCHESQLAIYDAFRMELIQRVSTYFPFYSLQINEITLTSIMIRFKLKNIFNL